MTNADERAGQFLDLVRSELEASVSDGELESLRFLAAGEYTLNYRVTVGGVDAVLRVVTSSQMGLQVSEQALYEAHALQLLAPTSRVPSLLKVKAESDPLGYPYLLSGYLPGRPLDYRFDLKATAQCVAEIHRMTPPAGHRLQLHQDPVRSILDESMMLVDPLRDARWAAVKAFKDRVSATPRAAFDGVRTDLAIINTDLNSHNFIVNNGRVWLLDWEKARIGSSLMDIAHFLIPTTTLWRDATATRLSEQQRDAFLDAYLAGRPELDAEAYRSALRPAMRLAAVRAISWCAWSLAANERGERPIQNEETLKKSQLFTDDDFLDELTEELWV